MKIRDQHDPNYESEEDEDVGVSSLCHNMYFVVSIVFIFLRITNISFLLSKVFVDKELSSCMCFHSGYVLNVFIFLTTSWHQQYS